MPAQTASDKTIRLMWVKTCRAVARRAVRLLVRPSVHPQTKEETIMKLRDLSFRGKCFNSVLIALAAIQFAIPGTGSGQGYFGTVSGTLADQTGAVLPGARVLLVDE